MARNEIKYEITADSSDATSEFKKVAKAGETAGKDIAQAFNDAGAKSEAAFAKFVDGMGKTAAEAKRTIEVVDKIGQQFKEIDADSMGSLINALRRAGVEFDTIEANADQLVATLREVDGVQLEAVNRGLTSVDTGLRTAKGGADDLTASAQKSRNAMANMVGNAAQDLGALGGVTGSLGVAFGQLAEGAADAANDGEKMRDVFSGVAGSAGPIAALALGTIAATKALEAFRANSERTAEMTKATSAAILAQSGVVEDLDEALSNLADGDALDANQQFLQGLFEMPAAATAAASAASALGIEVEGLGDIFAAIEDDPKAAMEGLALAAMGLTGPIDAASVQMAELISRVVNGNEDAEQAMVNLRQLGQDLGIPESVINTYEDIVINLEAINDAQQDTDINQVARDQMAVAEALAVVNDGYREMLELAKERAGPGASDFQVWEQWVAILNEATGGEAALQEGIAATGAAQDLHNQIVDEATAKQEEYAAAVAESADDLKLLGAGFDEAAARGRAMQTALEHLNVGSALTQGQEVNDFVDSLDGLVGALDKLDATDVNNEDWVLLPPPDDWQAWLNMPDEAQGVIDALAGFRDQIQSEMSQAFEAGGSTQAKQWADNTRQAVIDSLTEMGVTSQSAIDQILSALGLLDDQQIQLQIDASEAELARQKLEVLQGVLDQLAGQGVISPQVIMEISGLALTDPEAALAQATALLEGLGIDVPASLELDPDEAVAQGQSVIDVLGDQVPPWLLATGVNPEGAQDGITEVTEGEYTATVDVGADPRQFNTEIGAAMNPAHPRLAAVNVIAYTKDANDAIDAMANPTPRRNAPVYAIGKDIPAIDTALETLARDRTANIDAALDYSDVNAIEFALDILTRNRTATVNVVTRNTTVTTRSAGGGGPSAGPVMAPAAGPTAMTTAFAGEDVGINPLTDTSVSGLVYTAPMPVSGGRDIASPTIHNHVTISAAVIGSRFDVQRAVTKALRQSYRLAGSRV